MPCRTTPLQSTQDVLSKILPEPKNKNHRQTSPFAHGNRHWQSCTCISHSDGGDGVNNRATRKSRGPRYDARVCTKHRIKKASSSNTAASSRPQKTPTSDATSILPSITKVRPAEVRKKRVSRLSNSGFGSAKKACPGFGWTLVEWQPGK